MAKRWLIDVLIGGTAITGLITLASALSPLSPFLLSLAVINLATAGFLATGVRPLVRGTVVQRIALMHVSLVALLGSSAVAFWLEYLTLVPRLGALTAALTWTLAAGLYLASLGRRPEAGHQAGRE